MASAPSGSSRRFAAALVLGLVGASARAQETPAAALRLDELAAMIAGDPAQAWAAVHELRAIESAPAKDRNAARKLAARWAAELASADSPNARIVRAHAIGALGELGEPAATALAKGCSTPGDPFVRLACALALADVGEAGVKAAAKELGTDDLVGGALICAAFARPRERSTAATKALEKAAGPPDEFRDYLLSEAALVALEILGEDTHELLQKRERELGDLAYPVAKGLNWGGVVEAAPHTLPLICGTFQVMAETDIADFAKPPALRKHRTGPRLGDQYADYLGHLTRVTGELLPPLEQGSIVSLDDYAARARSWLLTIDLLMQIEERFVPQTAAR